MNYRIEWNTLDWPDPEEAMRHVTRRITEIRRLDPKIEVVRTTDWRIIFGAGPTFNILLVDADGGTEWVNEVIKPEEKGMQPSDQ